MCSSRVLENIRMSSKYEDKPIKHVPEHIVDQGLEDCRGIGEAKGHHQVFVMPSGSVECSLPLIPLSDADEVVSIAKVKLGEDGGSLEQLEGR